MIRFTTANALFAEFPTLAKAVKVAATDHDPRAFVRTVAADGKLREAVAICAYLMPKREAVLWTCHSLRSRPQLIPAGDQALLAAEAWAREPNEEARDIAAQWGKAADQQEPTTWAAYAAGFTSGNLAVMPEGPIRTPPHLTAESARVALLLAECKLEGEAAREFLRGCLATALRHLDKAGASERS